MKRYIGTVCVTYYQEFEVEAQDEDAARLKMVEQFDLGKADCGTFDTYDIEEIGENHADDR